MNSDQVYGYALTEDYNLYRWNQTANSQGLLSPYNYDHDKSWSNLVGRHGSFFGVPFQGNKIYSWGSNNVGQLGNGKSSDQVTEFNIDKPISFSGIGQDESISSVVTSGFHSFAFTNKGRIYSWG